MPRSKAPHVRMARGAWYYSAEQDVGYCGALRTHRTIVTRDPIFGEMAYGGLLTREGGVVKVVPRDGLRVRFDVVRDAERLHLELERDGFAKEESVVIGDGLSRVEFAIENRTGDAHDTRLTIAGLPPGEHAVSVNGRRVATLRGGAGEHRILLPVPAAGPTRVTLARSPTVNYSARNTTSGSRRAAR